MSDEELDCLIELLNEAILEEVLDERVLRSLCCNFATCVEPTMSETQIRARKLAQAKSKGRSFKDLTVKLRSE